jgi:hypothetical protein
VVGELLSTLLPTNPLDSRIKSVRFLFPHPTIQFSLLTVVSETVKMVKKRKNKYESLLPPLIDLTHELLLLQLNEYRASHRHDFHNSLQQQQLAWSTVTLFADEHSC